MNEFYVEQLVPSKVTNQSIFMRIGLVVLTLLAFAGSMIISLLFYVAVILGVVTFMSLKGSSIEYEYIYLSGSLDIDKVIAKQKRKHMYTADVKDMIVIAPLDSVEVRPFQNVKTTDYSSGEARNTVYKMVLSKNGEKQAILLEPNQEILDAMKMIAPRKVFMV